MLPSSSVVWHVGSGTRRLAGFAPDVRSGFEAAGLADVVLEAGAVLAEVVPAPSQPRPVGAVVLRKMVREPTDFRQMLGQIVRRAPSAVWRPRCMRNGSVDAPSHTRPLRLGTLRHRRE